jgi:hypothetical protein
LIVTGPAQLREQLRHLPTLKLIAACARLRPGHQLGNSEQAMRIALNFPYRWLNGGAATASGDVGSRALLCR